MAGKLSYVDWLKKSGRRSSADNARAWAKWAGMPAPKGRGRTPSPPPRTRGPGAPTPEYMGYGGAVDPSFGGTPLSTPADSGMVWTGKGRPDLAEIGRGGYTNLTPKKRPDGGWDVYGNPLDPTPQWGKDYLSQLGQREQRHYQDIDTRVAPWLANVLGSAETVNQQTQTDLANRMASVRTSAANAVPGGSVPLGMTGAGSGMGVGEDVANANMAQGQAQAGIGGDTYNTALNNLTAHSTAEAHNAALAQTRLQLPGEYDKMRMDFTAELGKITESIKENQRAREFQRQQALEQRRQWGLGFSEQQRAARAGEDIQRGALDLEERGQDWAEDPDNPNNAGSAAPNTQQRSLEQIRQDMNKGERLIDGPQGNGFPSEAAARRAVRNNKNVQFEVAEDGKWYGVYTPSGSPSSSSDGTPNDPKYTERVQKYPIDQYTEGKYRDPKQGEQPRGPGTLVERRKTPEWIVEDMMGRQQFRPADAWRIASPWIKKMSGTLFDSNGKLVNGTPKYNVTKLFVQRFFRDMKGSNNAKAAKIAKILNIGERETKLIITNGKRWIA